MGLRDALLGGSNGKDDSEEDGYQDQAYRYDTTSTERVQGAPVVAHGVDTELPEGHDDRDVTFASLRARGMLADGRTNPDAPIWLGIGTRRGRDVSIEQRSMFRHLACFGTTGYGKSTLQKNTFRQIAELGAGGCYIDPGGDDAEELIEILPEHRLDDVVWIEPGSTRGRVSGFNFLDTSIPPESEQFDHAVESLVADFRHMLGASQGWGARMDGVTASLVRASANTEYEFTPADLFYIIETPENSRRFAEAVRAADLELLADSADKIADVAENDANALEPLWRRFKDWVESPIARQFMSLRDSPIDIANAVDENKLIIVRMGPEDEDLKQMIGTAIFRRIWSVIRARAEMDRAERTPFYLLADEFDNLASQDGAIDQMLSESRKYRLSLFLSCQAPNQIQDVLPSLAANCDTWVSFSPGSPKDSRLVANNIGMDAETLQRDTPFHVWMTLDLPDRRQSSEPFRTYTLPEFPPMRTRDERDEMIMEYLHDHGLPTQTAEEVRDSILIRGGEGALEQSGALGLDSMVTEDNIPTDTILESLFVAAVRASEDNDGTEPVTTDRVHEEFETRTGVEMSEAKFSQQLETEYGERVEALREGTEKARLTDTGLSKLFEQDTGGVENAGGPAHRYILRESMKMLC
ncbi:TraM recognition domain-containing protein (plasmid) [Halococcus dombrowskii]|uniref:TraM recognition domain-containing protein n=1 Tax=Halococcus dombrowskii TaxID=179637 RepID=A0AAV3SDD0_HALDO|nr:TraM recognition domain-containing protein [Halococcus dombrowskii]UOO97492.1 TraM recognition domain-containing protein [Halococcus dombrowskii]